MCLSWRIKTIGQDEREDGIVSGRSAADEVLWLGRTGGKPDIEFLTFLETVWGGPNQSRKQLQRRRWQSLPWELYIILTVPKVSIHSNQLERSDEQCREFFNCLWSLSTIPLNWGHSCMPSPSVPDPIRVQACVWCLFWTNRNSLAVTSIFLSNQSYESLNQRYQLMEIFFLLKLWWGWKAMVVLCLIQSREQMADHQEEVNCDPLSLVIIAGTPKHKIHLWNMVKAHSAWEIPTSGITWGHFVNLSF